MCARFSNGIGIRTTDGGSTFTFLNSDLYPSQLVFQLAKSPTISNRFYVGMWGGGFSDWKIHKRYT